MTDKETTAQMLRRWADKASPVLLATYELYNDGLMKVGDSQELFAYLADRIEEEMRLAKQEGNNAAQNGLKKTLETVTGKTFRDAESLPEWLDRWYLPRTVIGGEPLRKKRCFD